MFNFFLFLLFAVFIPGFIFVIRIDTKPLFLTLFLSFCVGLILLTLLTYFAGYLGASWLISAYIFLANALFLLNKDYARLSWPGKISRFDGLIIFLILAGIIFQNVALLKSGRVYEFGVGYWGPLIRDGVWHEALARQLVREVPTQNPGFAGFRLTNYHYFYDLLVARSHLLTGLLVPDLIYRFYPPIFSLFLGLGSYLVVDSLFKNKLISLVAVFMAYFASSFGWIVGWIKFRELGGESAFWANQPVSFNLNPPYAVSVVLLLAVILLWQRLVRQKNTLTAFLFILVAGSIIEFKVYAGVIVLAAMALVALQKLVFKHDFYFSLVFLLTFVFSLILYWPQNSESYSLIQIMPFWLPNTMFEASDRVGSYRLALLRYRLLAEKSYFKLIVFEIFASAVFVVGNLGSRIIILVPGGLKNLKRLLTDETSLFLFGLILASFVPPLVFIQKGNSWNIVQFFYYFMFLTALLSGYGFWQIYKRLSKFWQVIFLLIFLILTPISSLATFKSWLSPQPAASISLEEHRALEFLSDQPQGTVFIHLPSTTAYVAAGSGQLVFLEDTEQQIILNTNYQERFQKVEWFFQEKDTTKSGDFLRENNISYIYLPKIYSLPTVEEGYPMVKIFENDSVNVYRVE